MSPDEEETADGLASGGTLQEVWGLMHHGGMDAETACEVAGFPMRYFRPHNPDWQEPGYIPTPAEIKRVRLQIRSGQLVVNDRHRHSPPYLDPFDAAGRLDDDDVTLPAWFKCASSGLDKPDVQDPTKEF